MKVITLITDFTDLDGYAGIIKGVILGIDSTIRIVDISHSIPAQDVSQAAWMLGRSAPYFPPGTVHVSVVDPGVGTSRRGIIAQLGGQVFVGPDNGLLTVLYQRAVAQGEAPRIFELQNNRYKLPSPSFSFHGRDVFAPAAVHFLAGVPMDEFGKVVSDPVLLHLPKPLRTENGLQGEVIHVDAFGNLAANINAHDLESSANARIIIKNMEIIGVKNTFGDSLQGELLAIIDSFGHLSICVTNGSAAEKLGAGVGEAVRVTFLPV